MSACNQTLLWTLVEQTAEPSEESESIARHIETCADCREKLTERLKAAKAGEEG